MRRIEAADMISVTASDFQYVLPNYQAEIAGLLEARKEKFLGIFFTNPRGDVTAIRGTMPSVLAATLTARFSRAHEFDITELFWKEFVTNPELGISVVVERLTQDERLESHLAEEKARKIIRRILDEYGDDSVREQASGYVMVREQSVLTSMEAFQHPLVTGIEASTRYINWSEKENGEYKYTRPPELMDSQHAATYTTAMDYMFDAYSELWPAVWDYVVETNPKPLDMSDPTYRIAVRGRVCDNLRKLLPLGIKTNFGIHANFRSLSELVMDLRASELPETRRVAQKMGEELLKVNPEFISVVESSHGEDWTRYRQETAAVFKRPSRYQIHWPPFGINPDVSVKILSKDYLFDLARAAVAVYNPGSPVEELDASARNVIKKGQLKTLLVELGRIRGNRRHKPPAFFENIPLGVRFEGISFGSWKDFNRQRKINSKSAPDWSGKLSVYVPTDIEAMGGRVKERYLEAQQIALAAHDIIARDDPIEARRLLTHGIKTVVEVNMGLGEAIWIAELRSIASGDPEYRHFAQMLYRQLVNKMPVLSQLKSFVDMEQYQVGRIGEAVRVDLKGRT